nr:IS3 family transposase [Bifidobacterium pseudolongum]
MWASHAARSTTTSNSSTGPGGTSGCPAPVRAAFEQSRQRYGYRRIWRVLRDQGIRYAPNASCGS